MQDEHALAEDRAAKARKRRQLIAAAVAAFLVMFLVGLWSGGILFAD